MRLLWMLFRFEKMGIYKIDYSTSTIGSNADKQAPLLPLHNSL